MIVPVLPHDHGIFAQLALIVFSPVRGIEKQPATMAVPKPFLGVVGVFFLVGARVMPDMVGTPAQRGILQRPSPRDQQHGLYQGMTLKAAMRDQPVIADRDAHAGEDIEYAEDDPVKQGVSVQKAEQWRADQCGCSDKAEQNERLIGKWRSPDGVWHAYSLCWWGQDFTQSGRDREVTQLCMYRSRGIRSRKSFQAAPGGTGQAC